MENKKTTSNYVNIAAEAMQVSYEEALAIMTDIETRYGISFSSFAKNHLFQYQGEELESQAELVRQERKKREDHAVKVVSETTGWSLEETAAEMARIREKFGIGPRTYWLRQLYQMSDEEILAYKQQKTDKLQNRLDTIVAASGWSKKDIKKHMAHCKTHFHIYTSEYYINYKCWELSDEALKNYAVDEDSRSLSKKYNQKVSVLTNKYKFNKVFENYLGRKYWLNRHTSLEEFLEFADNLEKVFCKPLNLSSGVGARALEMPQDLEGKKALYESLMAENELLVEEFILQHEEMSKMYPGSVNTVRLTMIKAEDGCHRLWSFARFGSTGVIDNFHGGGMAAAVNVETGELITDAMNSDGVFFELHPVTGQKFKGFRIPHWDKVKEVTEQALLSQDYIGYVGWDIAICSDKVVLVEGNSTPQVGVYQSLLPNAGQRPIYAMYLK